MTKKEKLQAALSEKGIEFAEDATIAQLEVLLADVAESTEVDSEGVEEDASDEESPVLDDQIEEEVEPQTPKGENPEDEAENAPKGHFYIVEEGELAYVVNQVGQRVSPLVAVEEAREQANRNNSLLGIKGVQI